MKHHTVLAALWFVVRLPVFALLIALEPLVRPVLLTVAALSVPVALLFEFLAQYPGFPFLGLVALGVGCALAMMGYYALLRFFAP